ncbi:MAG: GNAT family N-acetyltransferase [Chloroflexota bacterium]
MAASLSDAEALRRADANYGYTFQLMGTHARGGSVYEESGLVAVITGQIPWFNVAVVSEKLADSKASLNRAIDFYRNAGAPFVMRIRVGFEMETQRLMQELGLEQAERLPGMILNPVGDVPKIPEALTITGWDADSLPDYNEILAASFGLPLQVMSNLMRPQLLNSLVRGYLGYVDGRPVATSALVASEGVAGVYNVATLPDYRSRGLGEAMTWHAIREGLASGCVIGSLQASAMGQSVYARMGFRNIAPYETYMFPAQPAKA